MRNVSLIESIKCIKNLGPFEGVEGVKLGKFTLVYGENGRGKTMLSEAFRSLSTDAPVLVEGRKRLGDNQSPVVVLETAGGDTVLWRKDGWLPHGELPKVSVFNDGFIDANVYSGLDVSAVQRQGLHSVVVGEEGVRKAREHNEAMDEAKETLKDIDRHRSSIKLAVDGLRGADDAVVDSFVNQEPPSDLDERIAENNKAVSLAQKRAQIESRQSLYPIVLPNLSADEVRSLLGRGISHVSGEAAERVKRHISGLWNDGEAWVNEGWKHASNAKQCPYCGQPLQDSALVSDYGTYFQGAYADHKKAITDFQTTFANANNEVMRQRFVEDANKVESLQQDWSNDGLEVSSGLAFRAGETVAHWRSFSEGVSRALSQKSATPLEPVALDDETEHALAQLEKLCQHIVDENQRVIQMSESIMLLKQKVASANSDELLKTKTHLDRLKARGSLRINDVCLDYQRSCQARRDAEAKRERLKEELDDYRERIFREYGDAVNNYLRLFGTGFKIDRFAGNFTAGKVSSEYSLVIDDEEAVRLGGNETTSPRKFKDTLSAGDRMSLALAFFFACLDLQGDLGERSVVIDDPLSSLDHGRRHRTIEAIRYVAERAGQVVILSHDKLFLKELFDSHRLPSFAINMVTKLESTDFADWDILEECRDETEARIIGMERFVREGTGDPMSVRQDIRLVLEAYLRLAYADHFNRDWRIGNFVKVCETSIMEGKPILEEMRLRELKSLLNYANPPHHPSAPPLNQDDLTTQAEAALRFCRGAPV